MPSRKRQVLDCLDKRTLVDISSAFGYKGLSSLRKDEIASFLSRKGLVSLEEVLGHLKMAVLKRICWTLGENPGAVRKQVLIDRILGKGEHANVKKVVWELLDKLKREKLVLDWTKTQQRKAVVKDFIEEFFDSNLPDKFDRTIFQTKCDMTFMHVYDVYGKFGSEMRV